MLARCLRLFPPHLSLLTLCCAAPLSPVLLLICCVVCYLISLSPGFDLVKNPTIGHLLIQLSNNFFLVFVLEAIVVLGVQFGQKPLLLKNKSLSFYPWSLSIDVKLLPMHQLLISFTLAAAASTSTQVCNLPQFNQVLYLEASTPSGGSPFQFGSQLSFSHGFQSSNQASPQHLT